MTPLRGLTPAWPGLLQPSASSQRDSPRLLLRAFGHVVLWSDVSRVRCVTGSTVVTTCSFVPVDDDRPWGPAGLREHLPECRLPSQHPHPKLLPPRGHLPPSSVPSWPSECSGRLPASSWHTGTFPLPHAVLPRAQRTAVRGLCVHTLHTALVLSSVVDSETHQGESGVSRPSSLLNRSIAFSLPDGRFPLYRDPRSGPSWPRDPTHSAGCSCLPSLPAASCEGQRGSPSPRDWAGTPSSLTRMAAHPSSLSWRPARITGVLGCAGVLGPGPVPTTALGLQHCEQCPPRACSPARQWSSPTGCVELWLL